MINLFSQRMKSLILLGCMLLVASIMTAQNARVIESKVSMKTYPFSDADPVARPENLYYPYFRFDGFTSEGKQREWKTVELENDYIKVTLFPEIGGKIWGAVEKSTGKEFIYYNHVVKFRDIAMRGAWVSGGIEYNFGIIGHAPTSATPVDYITRTNPDGSVSCFLSATDYITRSNWTVEVNLPKDKAFFTTKTTWYNASSMDQPYYQWMNAGYKAAGDIQFCYPGNCYIGHDGESNPFPIDKQGRDLSLYKNNDFESSKSYHVMGYYNDFYGAYWHEDNFGSIHYARSDEKLGMKIFLWSQAQDGKIWEDLLTDTDGQYVELQSGKMYNQPATKSAFTPFKHKSFAPQGFDEWTEYWYPVKETRGISKASTIGAINWQRNGGKLTVYFSPVQKGTTTLRLYNGTKEIKSDTLQMEILKTWVGEFDVPVDATLKLVIGDDELVYSESLQDYEISRPRELPKDFDWNSVYGLYIKGEQWMNIKMLSNAEANLKACLEKDPYFAPALVRLASLMNQTGRYDEAFRLSAYALSIDTYDGEANYNFGLSNKYLGQTTNAKDGFSVATYTEAFRSAAYAQLAGLSIAEKDYKKAITYALKSLDYNTRNMDAIQELLVCYRYLKRPVEAGRLIAETLEGTPLNHIIRYEAYIQNPSERAKYDFKSLISNELPHETYLEMALWYADKGCIDEAIELCSFAQNYPIAGYTRAFLLHQKGLDDLALEALEATEALSPNMVFPFRPESLKALEWADSIQSSWKTKYYQALIYYKNCNKEKAITLLNQCDDADYAPLYLTRALLKENNECLNDLRRAEEIEQSWRVGVALINYFMNQNEWKEANSIADKYYKKYPKNYVVGLKYARTLCENGQYSKSIALLKKIQVLPNEGASAGRDVYRDSYLYQAINEIHSKRFSKALKAIEGSKIWLENLGVGKPYEDQIDYRLENFLEALATPHPTAKRDSLFQAVVNDSNPAPKSFNSNELLSVLALHKLGKETEANQQIDNWMRLYPDNQLVKWCIAAYKGDSSDADKLLQLRNASTNEIPWETSGNDRNFDLITKLIKLMAIAK
ncbi:DUF5107 domain-containing protein [Parabacteroides sp. Marseille-P3160]|uniref:DUF5107 domain-containing protein n=1 Tax=Parabacteroides sp. Marseille-P3160 TaxID=1917887 RepID=UPI001F18AA5F|nr:DUF5107 domain-containing protein [Parabacteroides sp. Marseille-P3160]